MTEIIFTSGAITLVQLSSAYLRYLPFSSELSDAQVARLRQRFLLWSLVNLAMNLFFFADGVSYRAFKVSFSINWLPYFLLSMLVIPNHTAQHMFVLGMQLLWVFMLHAFAGMGVALIFGEMTEELLPVQTTFYLLLFAVLFKVERNFFMNMLPAQKIFSDRSLRWCISILPFAIFFGMTLPIAELIFLPTWREKFSHVFFPIFFFMIYRSMSLATRQVEERRLRERRTYLLQSQMETLTEHTALIQKNQRKVDELQKNLLENYRVIEGLLIDGKTSEAMKYIKRQSYILDTTTIQTFSTAPLINAALSIYLRRAEEVGIKVEHKIDLPDTFTTDESDLAVLLSNLLENAITASKKQPVGERELKVIIRYHAGQYVLEISNRYNFPIKLGDNGLPYSTEIGHGLGMISLELFAKKYDAYVDFSRENGVVQLMMYWN